MIVLDLAHTKMKYHRDDNIRHGQPKQPIRDNLELHQNVSFLLTLLYKKLFISRTSRFNPKGILNNLNISPSLTHYHWNSSSHLGFVGFGPYQ